MNIIETRGRKAAAKSWAKGLLVDHGQSLCAIRSQMDNGARTIEMVDSETVGFFTGMRDCNGRKIFTGDIVEVTCPSDPEHMSKFGGKITQLVCFVPEFACCGFVQERSESELKREFDKIFGSSPEEVEGSVSFEDYYNQEKKYVWSLRELMAPKWKQPALKLRVIGNAFDNKEMLENLTVICQ